MKTYFAKTKTVMRVLKARAAEVHARTAEMAAAGKARVSDLWYRRKDSPSNVELAAEAYPGELLAQVR